MSDALSVEFLVITPMTVRRETIATSVGRKVTRHLNARRILLLSTAGRHLI